MRQEGPMTYSFGISLLFHVGVVVAVSLWMASSTPLDLSPKNYIELSSEKPLSEKAEPPPSPEKKSAPREMTPPKLIDKGDQVRPANPVEPVPAAEMEDLDKLLSRLPGDLKIEQGTPFAFLPPNPSSVPSEGAPKVGFGPSEIKAFGQPIAGEDPSLGGRGQATRGSEAGAGVLSVGGDVAVIPGGGTQGGGGGTAERGLGMGSRGLSVLTPGGGGMPESQMVPSTSGVFAPVRPVGVRRILPSYPAGARLAGVEGVSLLKVEVLTDGSVGRVLLEKSSGNLELDRAARAAVSQWRFAAARQGEKRIKAWVMIPIRFRLSEE
ncbi:MAG: energy transducer TonB [candidate division NC10 bacterium]|nr:energy transducer TonB [candidate division NC10 bacterium]